MSHVSIPDLSKERLKLGELAPRMMKLGIIVALAGLAAVAVLLWTEDEGKNEIFFRAYLVSACFYLSIALGGLFFVLVHHLARAGWSTVLRRLAEGVAKALFPLMALLFIPILIPSWGMEALYHSWLHPEQHHHAELIQIKTPYLNYGFFLIRMVIYFALWGGMAWFFFSNSTRQDGSGDEVLSRRMQRLSAPGMIIFALTITFAAFDLLMSLDPTWFSTIFGVYYFAGTAMSFYAFLAVLAFWLQRNDRLTKVITEEHYHDVGKFAFTFIVFWTYIAFSQYMLIWYGNIPEETNWYKPHHENTGWIIASTILLVGHFFLPFLFLMSRYMKRNKKILLTGAVWLLLMHWFDLYWLVMPRFIPESPDHVLLGILMAVGMGGVFVAGVAYNLRSVPLVPQRDPRLVESLAFENF